MPGRFTDGVFVSGEMRLDVTFTGAQARLANLTRGAWLLTASRVAYGEGAADLARAGPPGSVRGMFRLVQVHVRDLMPRGDPACLALRWEATEPGGGLFPALDADLTLSPAGERATTLTLAGVYRPPPTALGGEPDPAIVRRVATATICAFIGRVAEALAIPVPAAAPGNGAAGRGRSWPPACGAP